MLIIGLTGGIASGKSTVAEMLSQKGAHILDADVIAREVVAPEKPAWQEIVNWLGESILKPDSSINRQLLSEIVFRDHSKLNNLNLIVHPRVGARLAELSAIISQEDADAVLVYDVPLLIESGLHQITDMVLLVYLPADLQIVRLQERDSLTRDEAMFRLTAQMPLEEKKAYADVIIDNSQSRAETAKQVDLFWNIRETYRKS